MYHNIPVDWNAFQAVNSGKERNAFENLSYLLFCHEFRQEFGIFRYFNQHSIETEPVCANGDVIGFQSKYRAATVQMSDTKNVDELKDAIRDAKLKYPQITKLNFYVNKEFSQNKSGGEPKYKTEIEDVGTQQGITIEWRVPSHFEQMLSKPELSHVRDLYFNANQGISYYCNQIFSHRSEILDSINTSIIYNANDVCFEQSTDGISDFVDNNAKKALVIHGASGAGKSATLKNYAVSTNDEFPIVVFRASDFDVATVSEFARKFGDYTFDEFLHLFAEETKKIFVIDSAEKILFFNNQTTALDVINTALKWGWKLIFTVRSEFVDDFTKLINIAKDDTEALEINIAAESLDEMAQLHSFDLPTDGKLLELLRNPMFLKLWLRSSAAKANNISEFYDIIWDEIIVESTARAANLPARRSEVVLSIAEAELNGNYGAYSDSSKSEAISALEQDGVLIQEHTALGYLFSHDVFGQIAAERYLCSIIPGNPKTAFSHMGNTVYTYRVSRELLKRKLSSNDTETISFINSALSSSETPDNWKRELAIAVLSSDANQNTISQCIYLKSDDFGNDTSIDPLNLLLVACQQVDGVSRIPYGGGWEHIIGRLHANPQWLPLNANKVTALFDVLYQWVLYNPSGETTNKAGDIADYYYTLNSGGKLEISDDVIFTQDEAEQRNAFRLRIESEEKVCEILLLSAIEISDKLDVIFESAIATEEYETVSGMPGMHRHRKHNKHESLCRMLLRTFYGARYISKNSKLFINVADYFWRNDETTGYYETSPDVDGDFGLETQYPGYRPVSAFQGPFWQFLKVSPIEAIKYIVGFVNRTTEKYIGSDMTLTYEELIPAQLCLPGQDPRVIQKSHRLWQAYRGTSVAPDLLQSALMALEKWMSLQFEQWSDDDARDFCFFLLQETNSAAIVSLIVGLIAEYPDKLFDVALCLIRTKEIFLLDIRRVTQERDAGFLFGLDLAKEFFEGERRESNSKPHRKDSFRDIVSKYLLTEFVSGGLGVRSKRIYDVLDEVFADLGVMDDAYKYLYYHFDAYRNPDGGNIEALERNGLYSFRVNSVLPEDLAEQRRRVSEQSNEMFRFFPLQQWAIARFNNNQQESEKYPQFDKDISSVTSELLSALSATNSSFEYIPVRALLFTATVLIRNYWSEISEEYRGNVSEIIMSFAELSVNQEYTFNLQKEIDALIVGLLLIIKYEIVSNAETLLLALLLRRTPTNGNALTAFGQYAWQISETTANLIIRRFIDAATQYTPEKWDALPLEFLSKQYTTSADIDDPKSMFSKAESIVKLQTLLLLPPANENALTSELISLSNGLFVELFSQKYKQRDFEYERGVIQWLAEYLLSMRDAPNKAVSGIFGCLDNSDNTRWLIDGLIFAEDRLHLENNFWRLWDSLLPYIKTIVVGKTHYRANDILVSFALAFQYWPTDTKQWHSLQKKDLNFYDTLVQEFGANSYLLYSISRVLNTIGFPFVMEGLEWLYTCASNNPTFKEKRYEEYFVSYTEKFIKRFIDANTPVSKTASYYSKLLKVIDFLILKGSTLAFSLRDSIS